MVKRSYTALTGHVLSENSVILASISVVCIAVLGTIGLNVSHLFTFLHTGAIPTAAASPVAAVPVATPPPTVAADPVTGQSVPVAPAPTNPGYITLSDGTQVNLGPYNSNLKGAIEASGANGTTNMLASTLESVAISLVDKGELTQAQANMLIDLANKGHQIAGVQKFMEDMINAPGATIEALNTTPFTYNGVTYPYIRELTHRIGICGGSTQASCQTNMPYGNIGYYNNPEVGVTDAWVGTDTLAFLQQYEAIKASGMLADPAVSALVKEITSNIAGLADNFETTVAISTYNNTPPTQILPAVAASYQTNTGSTVICTTGSGSDTGTSCQ